MSGRQKGRKGKGRKWEVETGDWKLELTNAAMNCRLLQKARPGGRTRHVIGCTPRRPVSAYLSDQTEAEAKRHSPNKNEEKSPDTAQDVLDSDINGIEPR